MFSPVGVYLDCLFARNYISSVGRLLVFSFLGELYASTNFLLSALYKIIVFGIQLDNALKLISSTSNIRVYTYFLHTSIFFDSKIVEASVFHIICIYSYSFNNCLDTILCLILVYVRTLYAPPFTLMVKFENICFPYDYFRVIYMRIVFDLFIFQ